MKMADYSNDEATRILSIYRALFPSTHGALAAYWDFERHREWSLLTTDFHNDDLPAITALDTATRQFENEVRRNYNLSELINSVTVQDTVARRYRELAIIYHAGYSLGVSPITDDLLLRTFSEKTKRVVIVLGHDWYPIVTTSPDGRNLFLPVPPLRRYSILSEKSYEPAVRPLINRRDCAIVFLNLYPDFRGPGINKLGSLGDYTQWVKGFIAVCESIAARFELAGVISWGTPVWTALRKRLDTPFRDLGIMAAVEEQHQLREPLSLPLGAVTIPYFPFAHPSFATNFKKKSHWVAYQDVCSRLIRGIDHDIAVV
jgi:hypothetical protein